MKKAKLLFYSLLFFALSFPAKAFGMQDLYGPMQIKYGVPLPSDPEPWYLVTGRWLIFPFLPILIIAIIVFAIFRMKKKKR
jgi:hypothetical protein